LSIAKSIAQLARHPVCGTAGGNDPARGEPAKPERLCETREMDVRASSGHD
jgi:hypothetical protein